MIRQESLDYSLMCFQLESELLLQSYKGKENGPRKPLVDLLVVTEDGNVLAEHPSFSYRWHGCRAVDQSGGTLAGATVTVTDIEAVAYPAFETCTV